MLPDKHYAMDTAHARLVEIIAVLRFLYKYWKVLPHPETILDIATQELANIATPGAAWKAIAKHINGLHLPAEPIAGDETDLSRLENGE